VIAAERYVALGWAKISSSRNREASSGSPSAWAISAR
jgi:hypothetical protein